MPGTVELVAEKHIITEGLKPKRTQNWNLHGEHTHESDKEFTVYSI
jgi:hypothetical protein